MVSPVTQALLPLKSNKKRATATLVVPVGEGAAVIHFLAGPDVSFVTGQCYVLKGGYGLWVVGAAGIGATKHSTRKRPDQFGVALERLPPASAMAAAIPVLLPFSPAVCHSMPKRSWIKISQIRTLAVERIGRRLGVAPPEELARVIDGINEIIG